MHFYRTVIVLVSISWVLFLQQWQTSDAIISTGVPLVSAAV